MALLDFEGFDRESNENLQGWFNPTGRSMQTGGVFGYGRYNYQLGLDQACGRYLAFANQAAIYMNVHVYFVNANYNVLQLWDGGSVQITLSTDTLNRLVIKRNSTVLATHSVAQVTGIWKFLQIFVQIHSTTGSYEVRMDGVTILSATNVNTQATANAYVNGWTVNGACRYDNVVLYSNSGAAPNTFTPETRIYGDLPTGAGAATGWTPSAGANYAAVDEDGNDADSTYVAAAAAVTDDLYAYGSPLVPGAIVYGVACEAVARKDDAGTNDLDLLCKSGATTAASGTVLPLSTTYQRTRRLWTVDPGTGAAWTVAGANAAQVGARRTA